MGYFNLLYRTRWIRIALAILILAVVYTRRGCFSETDSAAASQQTEAPAGQ
jgi:hypothetical protein